jgi:hypothetical protein
MTSPSHTTYVGSSGHHCPAHAAWPPIMSHLQECFTYHLRCPLMLGCRAVLRCWLPPIMASASHCLQAPPLGLRQLSCCVLCTLPGLRMAVKTHAILALPPADLQT